MFAWPASSSKAIINCDPNMRFGFRNVSIVTISGLEFVGCFENYVVSATRFQLENSGFLGNGQAIVGGTALIIEGSVANLDKVLFIDKLLTVPQVLPENCSAETMNVVIGILLKNSNISITQSWFKGNKIGLGAVIYVEFGSNIMIFNTIFANNSATRCCSKYHNSCFAGGIVYVSRNRSTMKIYHSKFEGNFGVAILSYGDNIYTDTISIVHSEFINNSVTSSHFPSSIRGVVSSSLVALDGVMITVSLSKFINNRVGGAVVYMPYYTTAENVTNNVFIDNSAAYEVFINSFCRPGLGLSLSSSRCIQCSETWKQELIGIVIAAFIAGIFLVIFMLALNMTVAVGTLNGILFYANIVYTAANTHTFLAIYNPRVCHCVHIMAQF